MVRMRMVDAPVLHVRMLLRMWVVVAAPPPPACTPAGQWHDQTGTSVVRGRQHRRRRRSQKLLS